ncbi:MAG: Protein containing Heat shock protein Hsp20 protein [Parcubacteria group bacterium GW2011_GWC2_45_7]|nr:MAG: Protein containing Heat shock protein Hsp20 protein [Parcubacteria group bacterium GW2011_GWC2_45_7]KKU73121.1 MAG: Protein containing Heat shock protein Hsp20 protein [Parcubacteria group bacterium GW2011_GWA2_47_26]
MPDYSLEFLRPEISTEALAPLLTHHDEGELAVDIYETDNVIFIKTAIAGVKPEDLSLSLTHDLLTIRGKRHDEDEHGERKYLCHECHWGKFSRSIILPADIKVDKAEATFKSGILIIKLPKAKKENAIKVKVEEE